MISKEENIELSNAKAGYIEQLEQDYFLLLAQVDYVRDLHLRLRKKYQKDVNALAIALCIQIQNNKNA